MTLLERLKELNATTGKLNGDEDLGHWADREKHENAWVRDVALPALIEVVEAAKAVNEWDIEWFVKREYCEDGKAIRADLKNLNAALAKLTEEAVEGGAE